MRDSAIFYRSFYDAIKELPKEEQPDVWAAIFEYAFYFKELLLTGVGATIFRLIKPQLDANIKKYNTGKEYGHLGAEHGNKGGRPTNNPQNEVKKPSRNPQETLTKPANVNDNANENVNNIWGYSEFVAVINSVCKRQYRGDGKSKAAFGARVKDGYKKEDFIGAIEFAAKDKFHIEQGYKYLTPEFFTRGGKLDKFLSLPKPQEKDRPPQPYPEAKWNDEKKQWDVPAEAIFGKVKIDYGANRG